MKIVMTEIIPLSSVTNTGHEIKQKYLVMKDVKPIWCSIADGK